MVRKCLIDKALQAATNTPTEVFPVFSLSGREVGDFRPAQKRLARMPEFAPRAGGRRLGGRGGSRASPAPLASSGRRRGGSGCGSGSPTAGRSGSARRL